MRTYTNPIYLTKKVEEVKKEDITMPDKVPRDVVAVEPKKNEQTVHKMILSTDAINTIIKKVRREGIMKRAINFGIIGLGQGGTRLAKEFEKLDYKVLAINTSEQDLNESDCAERLLIGSGGAGRDLKIGSEAVNVKRPDIMSAYQRVFTNIDHAIVCAGSSGGTGGGGLINIIDTLADYKVPVGVITTLPLNTEDTRSKRNTLAVLNELVKLNAAKKISPLIIIDNNKIEKKYPGLSTLEFWNKANEDVVKCFDLFNLLSSKSSAYTSLDPMDYRKILMSGGCMIFGNITVAGEIAPTTISEAIMTNINSGLLAEGFNLVEATTAGCIIASNAEKLKVLPRAAEENAFGNLMRVLGSGTLFKGVYALNNIPDYEVFFMISGLGLPASRIKELIMSTKEESKHLDKKATTRTVDDIMKDLESSAQ